MHEPGCNNLAASNDGPICGGFYGFTWAVGVEGRGSNRKRDDAETKVHLQIIYFSHRTKWLVFTRECWILRASSRHSLTARDLMQIGAEAIALLREYVGGDSRASCRGLPLMLANQCS